MTEEVLPGHLTLAMIKPHAFRAGNIGEIISRIEKSGFKILIMKTVQLRKEGAEIFYKEHKGKDFYKNLINVMCSGPIVPIVLMKHGCVPEFRALLGATHPAEADPGTIRYDFGNHNNVTDNAVHGSATETDARREIAFFFGRELKLAEKVDAIDRAEGIL